MREGFRNGLGRLKAWRPAARRLLSFLDEVIARFLQTKNPYVMDEEVRTALAGKTSEYVATPKVD